MYFKKAKVYMTGKNLTLETIIYLKSYTSNHQAAPLSHKDRQFVIPKRPLLIATQK